MIELTAKTEDRTKAVKDAAEKAAFKNFGHAGQSIINDAKSSIEMADGPSPAGTPPHTHKRKQLRGAIQYDASKTGVIAGPAYSKVGTSGEAHELGGEYKGQEFDKRPFMGPALERALPRANEDWRGSIRQ